MKRMEHCGVLAIVLLTMSLIGCGGQTASSTSASISGVATPSSVSVVTAKNAD